MHELRVDKIRVTEQFMVAHFSYARKPAFVAHMYLDSPMQLHPVDQDVYEAWMKSTAKISHVSPFTIVHQCIAFAAHVEGLRKSEEIRRVAVNLVQNEATVSELLDAVHKATQEI